MRTLRYALMIALLATPFALAKPAQAQVAVGIGIGPDVGYPAPYAVAGPPVCEWGYYSYYPYDCAPYGFYGPDWFYGGLFIGAGPWYHGWYGRGWGYGYGHVGYYGRGFGGYGYRGGYGGFRGGYGGGYRGGAGGGYRGGGAVRGGGGGHGGGGRR